MRTHDLKIGKHWLDRVVAGEKRAEIRKHDRDYQAGDVLHMTEIDDYGNQTTYPVPDDEPKSPDRGHRTFDVRVTHVLDGRMSEGLLDGYCLLSIEPVWPTDGVS